MNEVINTIFTRRSIRKFQSEKVDDEIIKILLQAAMAAPSACNSQPWEFIVVTKEVILKNLQSTLYSGNYQAPAAIVVCGNPALGNNSAARHFWVQDCSAAAENILIAASALGLGSVWIGVYPLPSVIKPVAEILNLPENVVPLCVIYVGYPAEIKKPRTQYDDKRIYWQAYEPRKKRAKIKNAKKKE
jgi:nitroreductase